MLSLPKRKHPRLKEFDYGQAGCYHITICTDKNMPLLSKIKVGRGLAPAVALTAIGEICEEQLLNLENRYLFVRIDKYIIMPTHIHAIIIFKNQSAGASPRPTLTDIVCTFKSLSTRLCNQQNGIQGRKIFQTSFYDEVIRNEKVYQEIWQYINENPMKWAEDEYYRGSKNF